MHALETPTAYQALGEFNKLVPPDDDPIFQSPIGTSAEHFHTLLLKNFSAIHDEIVEHQAETFPMVKMDPTQARLGPTAEHWNTAWIRMLNYAMPTPLLTLKRIVDHSPEVLSCMVSVFEPGTVLPPHCGPFRGVMRYHLGVQIPEGDCGIKVVRETYRWRKQEGVVFDDTLPHTAWNYTTQPRIVIFTDILRPYPPALQCQRDNAIRLARMLPDIQEVRTRIIEGVTHGSH